MNKLKNIKAYPALEKCDNIINKAIRKVLFWNTPLQIGTEKWVSRSISQDIKRDDIVICFASFVSHKVLRYINRKYNCRCINYFWDKVSVAKYPVIKDKAFENWTFDLDDANNWGMMYNPQFFIDSIKFEKKSKEYDVFFCGADRQGIWPNRVKLVNKYYAILKKHVKNEMMFYLVSNSKYANKDIVNKKRMNEKKYFEIMGKSKTVLEIVEPNEEWLTLRVFQALSNGIKVITNNHKITRYDFYSPEYIFILGVDDISKINDFIEKQLDYEIDLTYYSMQNWVERFL